MLLLLPVTIFGQFAALKGKIYADSLPVGFVSVKIGWLLKMADSAGYFRMEHLQPGKKTLLISAIGYEIFKKEILLKENETIELEIQLEKQTSALEDMVVTGTMKA